VLTADIVIGNFATSAGGGIVPTASKLNALMLDTLAVFVGSVSKNYSHYSRYSRIFLSRVE
jgi:hypothetical protein